MSRIDTAKPSVASPIRNNTAGSPVTATHNGNQPATTYNNNNGNNIPASVSPQALAADGRYTRYQLEARYN